MGNWKATLKVKDLLTDEDVEPTRARELAKDAAGRLEKSTCFTPGARRRLFGAFEEVEDQDGFNEAMTLLYDLGDHQRVWIS